MPTELIIRCLTYDGSVIHTSINVALLALTLAGNAWASRQQAAGTWLPWLSALLLVSVLQVTVWFTANAEGISCIWSALAGCAAVRWRHAARDGRSARHGLALAMAGGIAGIVLYALWLPPITTVAHLVSVAIGAGIYALIQACTNVRRRRWI